MRPKNAMQPKTHINARAKEADIHAQSLMRSYFFERPLERLSKSRCRDNVIIKGRMLISSFVGVASRTTMDLNTTVTGFTVTHESAEKRETVVSRGVANTRPHGFYDIHPLWRTKGDSHVNSTLHEALEATCAKCGSAERMERWQIVLNEVSADQTMLAFWGKYVKKNLYASGIELAQCSEIARKVLGAAI
ncbi:hypothetical protein [Olsenella sp. HMSC062G07]|uniref:hypothetical protein n=1 Tax=Olsenella sp. HMSC062G07 TaxID=1739330 RepID=UPI0008A3CC71|nr:hypothetical protein [Olsenella sp. HMSC062G07]OFK23044.1 hypothetical protein HMPREF2826_00200 [Olsenella sp. HMSC062G07]